MYTQTRTDNALKSRTVLTVDVNAGTLTIGRGDRELVTYSCQQGWLDFLQDYFSNSAQVPSTQNELPTIAMPDTFSLQYGFHRLLET